jgi:XrtN system VIT domain protein
MTYAEHYLNIRNNSVNNNSWRGDSEEAIYTFQLPEGSVVTSLSLWVNGKEEKGILTSKQKATEAYTTIVGREMRDPSVVHWQEGNTVSVRVFPCTSQEERKFKIGITSPLAVINDKVVYKNVTFRGPNASSASQTTRIRFIGKSTNVDVPNHFKKNIKGEFISEGEYDADLSITMDMAPVKENQFSFDGFKYSLSEASSSATKVDFNEIYLDINNAWTTKEIESVRSVLENYKVYAYIENDFVPVSTENWKEVTDALRQINFSLFPFHHIKHVENAIVVTKGKELSPYVRDVKNSAFANGVTTLHPAARFMYLILKAAHPPTSNR